MLSQRRRHSRWRMFLVLLVFVGLIRHSELTSAGIPESSSVSSAPAARKKSQDLGSLSDFSWQAWFMVDAQAGAQPGMDSATLLRRITPKSIFIAPVLPACPDGYQEDAMERCVKNVNLDENAHFSFLLQRLNTLYANQKTSPQNKQPTGPLQLNIPLMPSSDSDESKKVEAAETLSQNDPLAAMVDEIGLADDKKTKHEVAATMYEVKNDTTSDDDENDKKKEEDLPTFFHENPRLDDIDKSEQKPDAAVPVAEIVETNNTSFSGVLDYKIPTDLKILLNASGAKRFNASNIGSEGISTTDKLINTTEMSPIMQLLSSTITPTTSSSSKTDDLPLAENNTVNHAVRLTSNHTSHVSAKEISNDNASDFYGLPMWNKRQNNETHAEDNLKRPENPKLDEPHETDFLYDEEEEDEYVYSTDMPDEESTEAEGEEILKHGEAGMTIPTRSPGRLHREQQRLQLQQQQNQTADRKKTINARDQVVIRFNDSTPADKDEVETNISSEVSIDGDLILETTLLDVNTEKLQVTSTQSPDSEVATKSDDNDDFREPYDQDHRTSALEVVFSPRESHSSAFTGSGIHERDQVEHSTRIDTRVEDERHEETLEAVLSSSESLLYDLPEQDQITEIHAIDEEQFDAPKESTLEDNSKEPDTTPRNTRSDSFVRFDDFERVPASHELLEDHVRFPSSSVRQPQHQAFVRFPSNEANSIHSLNHKHHSHQTSNDGAYGSTSTKSSVPIRQKPVYHLPGPSWKPDRQQDERATATAQRQKQAPPTLFRLWNKMPLIRDPSIFPVDQFPTNRSGDKDSLEGGPPAGRLHRSSSLSRSQRADEALARQRRRTPISG